MQWRGRTEVAAHRFSAPSCSQWLWGNVRKRSRRSESRWAHPFRRSEGRSDLSNTRTLKNLGTLLWHSNVSAPSARKLIFGICFLFFPQINVRLRRTFVHPKIRVRRQLCCSGVVAEVAAHRFSAPSCSQWLWGNVRERPRRSESRCPHPSGRSEGRSDLSNTRTLKNLGTLLWHSNVSAPSARKSIFDI